MAKQKELLKIPASINKITTMADKTLQLAIYTTTELTPEDETKIMRYRNTEGVMVFSLQDIVEEDLIDLPKFKKEFEGELSPSQRMRNIIYKIWETTTDQKNPFPDYYKVYMFKLNGMLKERIG